MKIGYIVLCHKDPALVAKLLDKITRYTHNMAIVHVDANSNDREFRRLTQDNQQVIFVNRRVPIHWGGFSSVTATVRAMQVGLENECDRFVVLQGLDTPLWTNAEIENFFNRYKDTEFVRAYNVTQSPRKSTYMKVFGYHMFDRADLNLVFRLSSKCINALNRIGLKYRRGTLWNDVHTSQFEIYWGWAHIALTKACVEYVVDFYNNNPKFNKRFETIFPADETYFQTIIHQSRFSRRTFDHGPVEEETHLTIRSMLNLTYFEYPKSVRVFHSITEVDQDVRSNYPFIRKIDGEYLQSEMESEDGSIDENCCK